MSSWKENIRKVTPYTPGEQPRDAEMIKLNTNENPYPPSPLVQEALRRAADASERQRLYPDPKATELTRAVAARCNLEEDRVFVGVGSDDVLAMCFLTFFNESTTVFFPDVTYSFYPVWAGCFGVPYREIPLDENFRIRPSDYAGKEGAVLFPNPNAPTGVDLPIDQIEEIVAQDPDRLVIVDEAYVDFGATSALTLLPKYENLLVVQTFSKSRSMAGMRIGYACGSAEAIRALNSVKHSVNSYTLNAVSIEAGAAAMRDEEYFAACRDRIIATREWAGVELGRLGFRFPESKANFLFVTHPDADAKKLFEELRARHIYVRYFDAPRTRDYLRVTIGTREQMEALFGALEEILHGQ